MTFSKPLARAVALKKKALEGLTEERRLELFALLLVRLDEQEAEDFFGTEGWKHYLDVEEEFDIV